MTGMNEPQVNPFMGTASAIRDWLTSRTNKPPCDPSNRVFEEQAVVLAGVVMPALVWLRDNEGFELSPETFCCALQIGWLSKLARHRTLLACDPHTNELVERAVPNIPAALLRPIEAYLAELPGYDPARPGDEQVSIQPSILHDYSRWRLTAPDSALADFAVSWGP